jgi:Zn-dependent protease with chaperone function
MNFYQAQEKARKQTSWLLVIFCLCVFSLILITNFCVAVFVLYSNPDYALTVPQSSALSDGNFFLWCENLFNALGWKKFAWTSLLVTGVIGMAIAFKWMSLRDGGRVVAESLGGRILQPNTKAPVERRLLNVVEEIALASGTPVPQIYILDQEEGINAFAAGLMPEDAVIGVTKGCLQAFNRDQLQGVIAHEFSHILNGDMRLNMKLIAVLHGIMLISEGGRLFMSMGSHRGRSYRHRSGNNGVSSGFFVFGLCLWLIGLLGQFFGALIKSAVSRQREYLADASAVQFTRNPDGIGEALSIIGGTVQQSKIQHHKAHELGHLFFSRASLYQRFMSQVFATHPPLEDRIKRVLPNWRGRFLKVANNGLSQDSSDTSFGFVSGAAGQQGVSEVLASGLVRVASKAELPPIEFESEMADAESFDVGRDAGQNTVLGSDDLAVDRDALAIDEQKAFNKLKGKAHEPFESSALVMAMLLSDDMATRQHQFSLIEGLKLRRLDEVKRSFSLLELVGTQKKIELTEIAIPTLKTLSLKQYQKLKGVYSSLIHADGKVDLFEWLIFQLLKQYCDRYFGLLPPLAPKYKHLKQVANLYEVVLSRIVHYGSEHLSAEASIVQKKLAFERACEASGCQSIKLLSTNECGGVKFTRSVHELSLAYPLIKPRLIKGLIHAAQSDRYVNESERYVITGIAAVMDCPLIGLDEALI